MVKTNPPKQNILYSLLRLALGLLTAKERTVLDFYEALKTYQNGLTGYLRKNNWMDFLMESLSQPQNAKEPTLQCQVATLHTSEWHLE